MSDDVKSGLYLAAGIYLTVTAPGAGSAFLAGLYSVAGSMLIAKALEEDLPGAPTGVEGALANSNSNTAYIPVIYGTRRVGGTRVFLGTHGTKNKYLDMVLVVAEGPIKGFRAVYLDDALCRFEEFANYVGGWVAGSLFTDEGSDSADTTVKYYVGDVVFHDNLYWEATQNSYNQEPGYGSAYWKEATTNNTILGIDKNGVDKPIPNNEFGTTYLKVGFNEAQTFTAGHYIQGTVSGATAFIKSVDAANDYLFIERIQNNTSTNEPFAISEGLVEYDKRGGTQLSGSATGLIPMMVKEAVYFKEGDSTLYTTTGAVNPSSTIKINNESKDLDGLVRLSFHNGSDTQLADSTLVSEHPDWTSNHRLRGKAYVYARFKYDKDKLVSLPNLNVLIDGIEVYDPRSVTTYFSSNPALCVRDYLTNTKYGRGIATSDIDDVAVSEEANYCDEVISITGSEYIEPTITGTLLYKGPRYSCNARIDTGKPILKNMQSLLSSMRGHLVFSSGTYKLLANKQSFSYHTFDDTNTIDGIKLTLGSKRSVLNEIKVNFVNEELSWQSDSVVYADEALRTAEDNGLVLSKDITLNNITNKHQAAYIGIQELKQSRQHLEISFKTGIEGLLVETGDVIRVRSKQYGWGTTSVSGTIEYETRTGANINPHQEYQGSVPLGDSGKPMYKEFKVLKVSLDASLETTITAIEYDETVYTTMPASTTDSTPNTNLSDTRATLPPTNLVLTEFMYVSSSSSGVKAGLQIDWDSSDSIWDQSYQISISEPPPIFKDLDAYNIGNVVVIRGVGYYENIQNIPVGTSTDPTTDTAYWKSITALDARTRFKVIGLTEQRSFNLKDVTPGWYIVRVESINVVGQRSSFIEESYEVKGLSAPPKQVTGLGLVVNNDNAVLTWDKSVDLDVLISGSVQVRHATLTDLSLYSTDSAMERLWQSSSILTEGKSGATTQVFLPLKVGTYLVKFIDADGNPSETPAYVINNIKPSATTTLVAETSELTDFTVASFEGLTSPADPLATTSGLEKISYNGNELLQFKTAAGTTFADTPTTTSAVYYLHNAFSFSSLVDAELEVETTMFAYDIGNLVSSWSSIDALATIDDPPYTAEITTKISTTNDDPSDSNAVWSEYFTFLTGTIKCRGARALVEIKTNSANSQVDIRDIKFKFYGKNRMEVSNSLTWDAADFSVGYKDIWYDSPFFDGGGLVGADVVDPILNISLNSTLGGLSYIIENGNQPYLNGPNKGEAPTTNAGFRIKIFQTTALNTNTSPVNAVVNFSYQAIGY